MSRAVPPPVVEVSSDGYVGATTPTGLVKLPKLDEPKPENLKRGYLWQAIPLPGPVDGILGAILSVGPIPRLLGLEPAPKARPEPSPLPFSWTGANNATFSAEARSMEDCLRDPKATEVGKRRIQGGTNANYVVTLSNGVAAIWTPKASEKSTATLRQNIPTGTQSKREEAAYLVDRRLGHLARVPPAVSSGLEGREGSLKILVSQAQDAQRTEPTQAPSTADYRRIALFDHVIGNLDRHSGNFLIDDQGRPIPIDHGLAFPTSNGSQGFTNFHFDATFQLDEKEKKMLSEFIGERTAISTELCDLLEPDALKAMFGRAERMLELGWVSDEWRQK